MARLLPLLLPLLLFVAIQPARAQDSEARFIRFLPAEEDWQGRLQTAIVSYENEAGVTLDLVAAVHIADPDYYSRLNDYFAGQDVVLYELVAEPDQRPVPGGSNTGGSLLGLLQQAAASFLDVGFQLRHIDYRAANFRHADLSPGELQALMAARNETFFSMFLNLALTQIANERAQRVAGATTPSALTYAALMAALAAEDQATAIKFLLAQELGRADGLLLSPEQEAQLIILGDRNRAALEALEDSLRDPGVERLSLFYGAAHMPGLERVITDEMGFVRTGRRWLDAWTIP